MRRLYFFSLLSFLFLSCTLVGYKLVSRSILSDGVTSVCDLVDQHFYKNNIELSHWVRDCLQISRRVGILSQREEVLSELQALMDQMRVSHFLLYTPQEDQKIWKGEAVDTGLRARWVEDRLVVFSILENSGAGQAGVKVGDEVVSIDGDSKISPYGVQNRSGKYLLSRQGAQLSLEILATPLKVDEGPQLKELSQNVGLLKISSFRSEYFEATAWKKQVAHLHQFSSLILDVRDNPGGNFVAMLRALSPLLCEKQLVGTLLQPRKVGEDLEEFADVVDDKFQIDVLEKYKGIQLKSYENYGCFRKPVTVLINSDSMSVTEIFAQALKSRPLTRVWGQPTAGDVVLAVWYDLPLLGKGFSISIPEAVFLTVQGEEIEGHGVWPQKELYYELDEALKGYDTWIEAAKK